MQDEAVQPNQDFLKKLRKKAELCRFSHSELKAKYSRWRDLKEFSVVLLSVSLAGLIGFYYRKVLEGDLVLLLIFILPLIITLVQTSDHTIFKWTHKAARHESAVAIWGDWIREADFLEKRLHQYTSDMAAEKMQNMQEKYNGCMGNTEQIPNDKFLEYKKKFRGYVLKSKEIDTMSLERISREGNREKKIERTSKKTTCRAKRKTRVR